MRSVKRTRRRPSTLTGPPRTVLLTVRITPAEYTRFLEVAGGRSHLSAWTRQLLYAASGLDQEGSIAVRPNGRPRREPKDSAKAL